MPFKVWEKRKREEREEKFRNLAKIKYLVVVTLHHVLAYNSVDYRYVKIYKYFNKCGIEMSKTKP